MAVSVIWTSEINTTAAGSAISKTGGSAFFYDASALSQQAIGGNGYVEFTSPSVQAHVCALGLSNDATANTSVGMSHAIAFTSETRAYVYESGVYRFDVAWTPGDVFKIEIFNDTEVRYLKSGSVFYTSLVARSTPVKIDVSILTLGAGFTACSVEGAGGNQAPVVSAGADQTITIGNTATLSGTVDDDDLPEESTVTQTWSKISGPGTVTFANAAAASTTATFSTTGVYLLGLTATDGTLSASDECTVTVNPAVAPTTYDLIQDLASRPLPELPAFGAAGSQIVDPTFSTPIWRLSDQTTLNGHSVMTPGAPNTCAWAVDSSAFYLAGGDGSNYPIYTFDASEPSWTLERIVSFGNEPCFARAAGKADILYGCQTSNSLLVQSYSRSTNTRTTLYNLRTDVPEATEYQSPVYASANTERVVCAFNGVQDAWRYVTVFEVANVGNRVTIDTRGSRIKVNGGSWATALKHDGTAANMNFGIHSISIDRSGTWVKLDVSGVDGGPFVTWFLNVSTQRMHAVNDGTWGGHYAWGWQQHVNMIADSGSDQPQWLFRDMTQGGTFPTYRRLIDPDLIPDNAERLADHTSWNNARSDALVPVITATYRSLGSRENNDAWLTTHNEVAAVVTADNEESNGVYHVCHHRMEFYNSAGVNVASFHDTPRPQVSPDGMWSIFTSNWGLTLGTFGIGLSNHRRDSFLVKHARVASTLPGAASSPSPANAATGVSLTPTLSITAGSGATRHRFYLGTTNPPTTLVADQATTSYVSTALTPSTQHFWRVDEVNAVGTTAGTVYSFTTTTGSGGGAPTPAGQPAVVARRVRIKRTLAFDVER